MKLAINFSREAAGLVAAGTIPLDFFKSPDWPDLIREARQYRPVAVHFGLDAGSGSLGDADWEHVDHWLQETGTPYVNLHLAARPADYPEFPIDSVEADHRESVYATMLRDVRAAVARFGAQRIIVENAPYHGPEGRLLRACVEPELIRRLVEVTGVGLLLDISHARIAAHSIGMPERAYLEALPVEQTRELHFTGLHRLNGRLADHLPVLESDWPALAWVLENIQSGGWGRPWMLAFEYGGVGKSSPGALTRRSSRSRSPACIIWYIPSE